MCCLWQVSRNIDLVYGGGSIGLMGLISQAVYNGGRHVIGWASSFYFFAKYLIQDNWDFSGCVDIMDMAFNSTNFLLLLLFSLFFCLVIVFRVIPKTLMPREVRLLTITYITFQLWPRKKLKMTKHKALSTSFSLFFC